MKIALINLRFEFGEARFLGPEIQSPSWILLLLCLLPLFMLLVCFFLSFLRLCLYLPLTENFLFFLLPLPAHCVVQPRAKSSQAHPGPPESGSRHRYLSPGLQNHGTMMEPKLHAPKHTSNTQSGHFSNWGHKMILSCSFLD